MYHKALKVHAIMYFYYFLAAVLPKPPKWARLVTAHLPASIHIHYT